MHEMQLEEYHAGESGIAAFFASERFFASKR
jgi:hypothetical protein